MIMDIMTLYPENKAILPEVQKGSVNNTMMLLKSKNDIDSLIKAVDRCDGEVLVCSMDKTEEFNLKSLFSRYIAIGELCKEHGDEYEIYCTNHDDEGYMIQFFQNLRKNKRCA